MITVLCGCESHPIVRYVRDWIDKQASQGRKIDLHFAHEDTTSTGVLFALSYGRILPQELLEQFDHAIVLHASDLPRGRGWSPHVWEILGGATSITVSAISAAAGVDEGDIWAKVAINIEPTDVYTEINEKLFRSEIELIEHVLVMIERGRLPMPQSKGEATYYKKRMPEDSRVGLDSRLEDIFDLLRIADPDRYPVFFEKDGVRFNLHLEKIYEDN